MFGNIILKRSALEVQTLFFSHVYAGIKLLILLKKTTFLIMDPAAALHGATN